MLMAIITFLVGLAGVVLLCAGAWLISPAAGLITGGVLFLAWSFLNARAAAPAAKNPEGE